MEILTMHDKIKDESTLGKFKKLLSSHAHFREKPPEIFKNYCFSFFFTLTRFVCFCDTYTVKEILSMHDKIKNECTLGKCQKLLSRNAHFREKPP